MVGAKVCRSTAQIQTVLINPAATPIMICKNFIRRILFPWAFSAFAGCKTCLYSLSIFFSDYKISHHNSRNRERGRGKSPMNFPMCQVKFNRRLDPLKTNINKYIFMDVHSGSLLDVQQSRAFREELSNLSGYDTSDMWKEILLCWRVSNLRKGWYKGSSKRNVLIGRECSEWTMRNVWCERL